MNQLFYVVINPSNRPTNSAFTEGGVLEDAPRVVREASENTGYVFGTNIFYKGTLEDIRLLLQDETVKKACNYKGFSKQFDKIVKNLGSFPKNDDELFEWDKDDYITSGW